MIDPTEMMSSGYKQMSDRPTHLSLRREITKLKARDTSKAGTCGS
jgi:hypothetical protein